MSTEIEISDLEIGDLRPVAQICGKVDGSRPGPSVIWRWIVRGLRGGQVRLNATKSSGRWYTTEVAYRRFLSDQTEAALQSRDEDHPEIDASDDALRSEGLL